MILNMAIPNSEIRKKYRYLQDKTYSKVQHLENSKYELKIEIRARNNPYPILPIYFWRIQVTMIIFQNSQKDKSS